MHCLQKQKHPLLFSCINKDSGEHKGSVSSCPRVLHVSFSCFDRFSLVLDPRRRLGGLGGKVLGVLVRNLWTMKAVCWVNVSESSGAGSPTLSQ